MVSPRHDIAERDGIVLIPRGAERDGLALAPQSGEGWKRPDTAERRGMVSPRHRRAERDGIVLIPRSGEGWSRPGTT